MIMRRSVSFKIIYLFFCSSIVLLSALTISGLTPTAEVRYSRWLELREKEIRSYLTGKKQTETANAPFDPVFISLKLNSYSPPVEFSVALTQKILEEATSTTKNRMNHTPHRVLRLLHLIADTGLLKRQSTKAPFLYSLNIKDSSEKFSFTFSSEDLKKPQLLLLVTLVSEYSEPEPASSAFAGGGNLKLSKSKKTAEN